MIKHIFFPPINVIKHNSFIIFDFANSEVDLKKKKAPKKRNVQLSNLN